MGLMAERVSEISDRLSFVVRLLSKGLIVAWFGLGVAGYDPVFAADSPTSNLSPWSLQLSPQSHVPLSDASQAFEPAFGGSLGLGFAVSEIPGLSFVPLLGYSYGSLRSNGTSLPSALAEYSLGTDIAYTVPVVSWMAVRAFAGGSMVWGGITTDNTSNSLYGSIESGLGLSFLFDPEWSLRLDGSWLQRLGLYGGLNSGFSVVWNIPNPPKRGGAGSAPRIQLLDFSEAKLGSVFPIMQTHYDDHPVGSVRITNTGKEVATRIRVSFLVRQYMDGPKECLTIPTLAPGESKDVPLYALFKNSILDVTEPTKAIAEVAAEYTAEGDIQNQSTTFSIRVYDRNALTWDDDRKAAAYVSGKDPWVLDLSNNITAAVKDLKNEGIVKNLQTAMAFHVGLRLYGLSYVTNPKSPFSQAFGHPETVDFLKFPRQTLNYRAGDCSDLSVLYASFFESVGVESAFLTIPGHIFIAFNLEMSPEEAKATLSNPDDVIVVDGKAWVPLEVTMRDSSLLEIWREAAREWRQGEHDGTAAFYPIHDAWKVYAPVGLSADGTSADPLSKNKIGLAFENELSKYVDLELNRKLEPINAALKDSPSPKNFNRRGVVLAKFGKLADAERDFKTAVSKSDFGPALVNLGNVSVLKLDYQTAYAYYEKATLLMPSNPRLFVSLAKVAETIGQDQEAKKAIETVKRLDASMAEQFSSPSMPSSDPGTRAAEKDVRSVLWSDEQ